MILSYLQKDGNNLSFRHRRHDIEFLPFRRAIQSGRRLARLFKFMPDSAPLGLAKTNGMLTFNVHTHCALPPEQN